ncbi:MAG TPA: preprotein translocase subunit SecG [Nevskiaceae bacterium]
MPRGTVERFHPMYTILVVLLVVVAIALMGLIMLQQGKGADAGAAFGTGVSGTMFGNRGGGTLLSHITAGLATTFFVITLALAYLANHQSPQTHSVVDRIHAEQTATQPAAPKTPAEAGMQTGAPLTVPPVSGSEQSSPTQGTAPPASAAGAGERRAGSGSASNGSSATGSAPHTATQTGAPGESGAAAKHSGG